MDAADGDRTAARAPAAAQASPRAAEAAAARAGARTSPPAREVGQLERDPRPMSRVGAGREREAVVPHATGVPRLAKPARHARYAREVGATASAKSWRGLPAGSSRWGSRRA